jgi:cation transport protein ChaC
LCLRRQIVKAKGPSGPNRDYLFNLEEALAQLGFKDKHVTDLANQVRHILSESEELDIDATAATANNV